MAAIPTMSDKEWEEAHEHAEAARLREARWHAMFGALFALGVQNHMIRAFRRPHGDNLRSIIDFAREVADEANEMWDKDHKVEPETEEKP